MSLDVEKIDNLNFKFTNKIVQTNRDRSDVPPQYTHSKIGNIDTIIDSIAQVVALQQVK